MLRFQRHTHSQRLERWLGAAHVEQMSAAMRDWYGPPIAVSGVPGNVWAMKGGDFRGPIGAGQFASALDMVAARSKKILRRAAEINGGRAGAGFASLDALISAVSTGKVRQFNFIKVGSTGVLSVTNTLWRAAGTPAAGAAGSAAPGGRALTDATTGAWPVLDNVSTETRHFVRGEAQGSVGGNTLLLYDRLFDVAKTMNSTATESVTGVPTRYQSSTQTAADYAGGNFIFVEVGGTALAATAHNWTVCLYRNQAGTDAQTMPSLTGNSSAIVDRLDHPVCQWFAPLATGDTGAMDLNQMQCSALVATGLINFVIGHPIAFMPLPIANQLCITDGIMSAFNLVRIFDDAALALLEVMKPATTATTYICNVMAAHS